MQEGRTADLQINVNILLKRTSRLSEGTNPEKRYISITLATILGKWAMQFSAPERNGMLQSLRAPTFGYGNELRQKIGAPKS